MRLQITTTGTDEGVEFDIGEGTAADPTIGSPSEDPNGERPDPESSDAIPAPTAFRDVEDRARDGEQRADDPFVGTGEVVPVPPQFADSG